MEKRRRWPWILLSTLGLLTLIFFLGPRVQVQIPSLETPVPPLAELESWLQHQEAQVQPPIRPGLQKEILWADPQKKQKTPLALVYIHGYSATKGELRPVPDQVAKALKANLYFARLTAAGQGSEGYKTVTTGQWLADGVQAIKIGAVLGEKVILMGTSTGGSLAIWLNTTPLNAPIQATVLVSPNLGPKDPLAGMLLWPWGNGLVKLIVGDYRQPKVDNPLYHEYWDAKHASESLLPMAALADMAQKLDLKTYKSPTLLFYSLKDQVVNPALEQEFFQKLPVKDKQSVEVTLAETGSSHVLAGDAAAPSYTGAMVKKILDFLGKVPNN